jgi:hypothetical protein
VRWALTGPSHRFAPASSTGGRHLNELLADLDFAEIVRPDRQQGSWR